MKQAALRKITKTLHEYGYKVTFTNRRGKLIERLVTARTPKDALEVAQAVGRPNVKVVRTR